MFTKQSLILGALLSFASACVTISSVTHTFYGWPDNDPAGAGTAYNCGGRNYVAGGTGTYSDPLTFASAPGEFEIYEIIYDPYTQKYLRLEDSCAQCTTDWEQSGIHHIDVWTGSNQYGNGQAQIQRENDLTPSEKSQKIVRWPATYYHVNSSKIFADGTCYTNNVNSNYDIKSYCSK